MHPHGRAAGAACVACLLAVGVLALALLTSRCAASLLIAAATDLGRPLLTEVLRQAGFVAAVMRPAEFVEHGALDPLARLLATRAV